MATQRAVKLERMDALLAVLDHPELRFPSVLVAGTKGKGSTVAMIHACLVDAGYKAGRYTSPHLLNWRERTVIGTTPISTHEVIAMADEVRSAIDRVPTSLGPLTTFEVGTALTFLYFMQENVDVAVVEVGTGGRFDATNLVEPLVSVIAPVSYDHTQTLGTTLTSIAWHKAGILRWQRPAVSAPQADEADRVIARESRLLHVPLQTVGHDWTWTPSGQAIQVRSAQTEPLAVEVGLIGAHQHDNATTAVAALHAIRDRFPVRPDQIASALKTVEWPGRLQVLQQRPPLVVDGAHNAASAEVVAHALDHDFRFEKLHLVVGLTEGKDALGVLTALVPRASAVYLTRSMHERSAPPAELERVVRDVAPRTTVQVMEDASSALDEALSAANPNDLVLVTGSLFLVGEALEWWRRSHP
jgi:dihydrofolate synthase/folylpolyglutamate synthase